MKTYNVEFINGGLEVRRVDECDMIEKERNIITKIMKETYDSVIFFSLDVDEKLKSLNKKINSDKIKIWSWEQLSKVKPNKEYKLDINVGSCYGWIEKNVKDNEYGDYLSTHTFYGGDITKETNKLLSKRGFDIELQSWED